MYLQDVHDKIKITLHLPPVSPSKTSKFENNFSKIIILFMVL